MNVLRRNHLKASNNYQSEIQHQRRAEGSTGIHALRVPLSDKLLCHQFTPLPPVSSPVQVKVDTPRSTSGSGLWQVVASSPNESRAPDLARQVLQQGMPIFYRGI